MIRLVYFLRASAFVFAFNLLAGTSAVYAAPAGLGLCPAGFTQGTVTTGSVDCYRSTSPESDRSEAQTLRLQREAVCLATPNAQVTSSILRTNGSGQFFSEIICTVSRPVPENTVFCPAGSEEAIRAFDTLVCEYFGSPASTAQDAQTAIDEQITQCTTDFSGRVLKSGVEQQAFEGVDFFTTFLSCAREIEDTDIIQCPYTYSERSRDQDSIECRSEASGFATIEEAEEESQTAQSICTGTTAGLGSVDQSLVGATSNSTFFSSTDCIVGIARYGDFADSSVIRACDASCTKEVEQTRACLNGGTVGSTGCTGDESQLVERRCNTGPGRDGLCPATGLPAANIVPLLLLDDDD
jgi:hypothetical protein